MRALLLWTGLMLLPLLTGCGNANDGRGFKPYPTKTSSSVQANPVQVGNQPPNQFQSCVSPTIYTDDAGFNSAFLGSNLCPGLAINSTARSNIVRLRVNTGVPANTRLCIFPFVYDAQAQEVCFSINGQADVQLSTNQYTSIVVVPETYKTNYQAWLNQQAGALPVSRLLFSL